MHTWLIYTVMSLTVCTGMVFFFVTVFQCHPISYFWDASQDGTCLDVNVIIGLTYLYSVLSAMCDFTFGILPVFLIWNLNMSRTTKWALVPILSMACLASTAVIVRMAYVEDFRTDDFLFDTIDIAIWSNTEPGLGITAGSLATLRPLYRHLMARAGWSQPSAHQLAGSPSKHQKKRSGPFSLVTISRHDRSRRTGSDTCVERGIGLKYPDRIRLRDDLVDDDRNSDGRPSVEKGFTRWEIQTGDNESEERLNMDGVIMKHTEVRMRTEPSSPRHSG